MLAGHHWSNHGYAEPINNPLWNAEDLTVNSSADCWAKSQ
jgi:hypothetical protein